jgi:hypothetical protein
VPAMKLTFTAAMRARDVSRPRAEHLAAAEAEAAKPGAAGGPRSRIPSGDAAAAAPDRGAVVPGALGPADAVGKANRVVPPGGSRDKAKPSPVAAAMDERRAQAGFPRRRRGRPSR